jgi:hypothetical protein
MSSFAQFGCENGPISGVPEDYKPEVMISDEEFDAIYSHHKTATNEELFHARDYSLLQFKKVVERIYEDETYGCPEDLLMTFPKERLRALFWGVDGCSCCWTHCHKRPVAIDSWNDQSMLDRATQGEIDASRCHCYCRMWKRKLRRAFFEVPDMPQLIEIESDDERDDETRSAGSDSDCEC